MDKHNLKNHITTLKKVRDACSSQLDSGVIAELDGVIEALDSWLNEDRYSVEEVAKLTPRALQVIANVVAIVTKISEYL